jgi:hypothetical protein
MKFGSLHCFHDFFIITMITNPKSNIEKFFLQINSSIVKSNLVMVKIFIKIIRLVDQNSSHSFSKLKEKKNETNLSFIHYSNSICNEL